VYLKCTLTVCLCALTAGRLPAADQLLLDSGPVTGYRLLGLEGESAIVENASGTQRALPRVSVLSWQRAPDQLLPTPAQDLGAVARQVQQNAEGIRQLQEAARLQYRAILDTRPLPAAEQVGLQVVSWQGLHNDDDYRVTGAVRNVSAQVLPGAQVLVQLLDTQGIARWQHGSVDPPVLAPGQTGDFVVLFHQPPPFFSGCRVIPQLADRALRELE
jgi:hypothetical protein